MSNESQRLANDGPPATSGPGRVGSEDVDIKHFRNRNNVPVPYALTIGAVSFIGILYLKDPIEDTYTDGGFFGAVNGTYHIDKDDTEVCGDNGVLKACIKVVYGDRKLFGRLCTRKITGGWDCGGWVEIMSW